MQHAAYFLIQIGCYLVHALMQSFFIALFKDTALFIFLIPTGAQGVKILCVCPSVILFKRTLEMSSSSILKSSVRVLGQARKQAGKQASRKAGRITVSSECRQAVSTWLAVRCPGWPSCSWLGHMTYPNQSEAGTNQATNQKPVM